MTRLLATAFAACLALFVSVASLAAAPPAKALPGDSVLQLADQFSDQQGRSFTLAQRRGHVQLVAMFYSSCPYACPLLVDSGKGVEHALSAAERAQLRLLYLSIDPARDDTKKLGALAAKRKLDPARWTLARTDEAGVRRTAAVLGVRYRKLANGEFNHSSVLILLDRDGRVLARTEKLGPVPDPAFVAKVKAALAKA
jgi:protein SCO1/2